jgi:hypothetical protein
MQHVSITKRFLFPLVLAVSLRQLSIFLYQAAATLPPGPLRNMLTDIFGPLGFICLWFFAFLGPPLAYYLGASFVERLVIAFANPVIWIVGIEYRMACQYSAIELVYFLFLPWIFGIMCVTCVAFSLSELACRTIHKWRTHDPVDILYPPVWILLTGGAVGTYMGLIKGQEWVYMVVHHYARHML